MTERQPTIPRTVGEIDWPRWRATDPATLVFVRQNGRVLLIRKKRGLGAGKINGPGGRVEPGESPEQCAIRETQEEIGVTPTGVRKYGELCFQFLDGYSIHVHVFLAGGLVGEPIETDEAVPLWFPADAIPYDEMWADDRLWLPLLLSERRFHGRFIFDDDVMVDWKMEEATERRSDEATEGGD